MGYVLWSPFRPVLDGALICAEAYVPVMAAQVHSVAEAREWAARNRYGIEPNRGYVRMLAGITRSFLYLGQDTVAWKRLLFRASGNRASVAEAAASGLWKVAIVYLVLAWLALRLLRRHRTLLWCLTVNAARVPFFAPFLFDPGPPERYYPLFPLLFLGFACVIAEPERSRMGRGVPVGLFVNARPFDPASRVRYQLVSAIPLGTVRMNTWKADLANLAFDSWRRGGHIRISLRVLAASPRPEWGWVEGDDQRISWHGVGAFFGKLDLLPPAGGADGFAELAPSEQNRKLLREVSTAR